MLDCQITVPGFVDSPPQWIVSGGAEGMFDSVPEDEDDGHEGDGGREPVSDRRILFKCIHIHAEETTYESQGEEYKRNPTESPHTQPQL